MISLPLSMPPERRRELEPQPALVHRTRSELAHRPALVLGRALVRRHPVRLARRLAPGRRLALVPLHLKRWDLPQVLRPQPPKALAAPLVRLLALVLRLALVRRTCEASARRRALPQRPALARACLALSVPPQALRPQRRWMARSIRRVHQAASARRRALARQTWRQSQRRRVQLRQPVFRRNESRAHVLMYWPKRD